MEITYSQARVDSTRFSLISKVFVYLTSQNCYSKVAVRKNEEKSEKVVLVNFQLRHKSTESSYFSAISFRLLKASLWLLSISLRGARVIGI